MIELSDVSIGFGGRPVLRRLDLAIMPGKTTVIVGRSGSGKSVLLKLMMGLLRPDSGRVMLFGRDLATASADEVIELRKRMGMLFQNYALLDSLPVDENVGFTLLVNSHLARRQVMTLAHELLGVLGLAGSEDLLPAELSGGMRKRVSLARALIANPEVVLLDEPTTGLDPIMVEKIDEMITLAKTLYRMTAVVISHDMASVERLADRVGFLHEGAIIFEGSFDEFRASRLPPVRAFLAGAQPGRLSIGRPNLDGPTPIPADEPVVEFVGVHKRFGDKHVLRGVDLAIAPGRRTFLIGGSGSGKSVLIKHMMGLVKPDRGQIRVFGQDIVPMKERALASVRRHFGLVFQHAALLDWLSVFDNVAFPLQQTGEIRGEVRARVLETLERLGIADLMRRMPSEISEGQKKRVGLARALVTKPEIMIYDEPTTGLDPVRSLEVDEMISEQVGITSLVVSHDMASTFRIAHTIAMIHEGRIIASGTPDELRASPVPYVQQFIHAGQTL